MCSPVLPAIRFGTSLRLEYAFGNYNHFIEPAKRPQVTRLLPPSEILGVAGDPTAGSNAEEPPGRAANPS